MKDATITTKTGVDFPISWAAQGCWLPCMCGHAVDVAAWLRQPAYVPGRYLGKFCLPVYVYITGQKRMEKYCGVGVEIQQKTSSVVLGHQTFRN